MRIEIQNLTKRFGEFIALRDVSLTVEKGETLALLGPNGSGKTTSLKCMVGLTLPTSGSISVGTYNLRTQTHKAKQLMSYLPQRVAFHDQLTAREVLQFYCRLRRLPQHRIDETLATPNFHFNGFSDKAVSQFSGGMLQRLGLAVACLPNAPILVLDEPTSSLDPEGAIQLRQFLANLKRQGKTIVFSSHILDDVEQLANRVAILVGGRLVALQSVSALRKELMETSRLRIDLDQPDPTRLAAAKDAGATEMSFDGNSLIANCRPEDRLRILRAVDGNEGHVLRFVTEQITLEDIYVRYVNNEDGKKK
ncbi:MAG: ABC transporter ATP-binding protein [Blastocatellia bacterium]|nr:MAG: ABC transporter ATP-binding protein [Blastocatellia bacterium]